MLDRLGSLIEELERVVGGLEPDGLSGDEAMDLCSRFAEVERLGAAGRIVTGARVAATEVWRRGGCRSAAEWVARCAGTDPERARGGLETAERLGDCPAVAAGLRAGRLSDAQASVLVDALAVRPELEERLVAFAGQHSLRRLREECRLVKSVSRSAAEESAETHRNRTLKMWTGRDGSFRFSGSAPGPAGAEFMARIEERKAKLLDAARKEGRREPFEALALDALMGLVTEERGGGATRFRPTTMMIVHVPYEALVRGSLADGEVCEIRGVGPIPLDVARRLAGDSILRVLVTKGAQPMAVTPGLRTIPRALRLLLEARDKVCAIRGCDVSRGLQIDHCVDFALFGPTDLENCAALCRVHHDMKTYLGFRRVRDDGGEWILVPPDDYLDPEPPDPAIGPTLFRNPWTGLADLDRLGGGVVDHDGLGAGAGAGVGERSGAGRADRLAFAGMGGPAP
ncbi:MAG: hypothetical protein QOI86_4730 [Actinomycetota bacterium]|nr:hypothetical protein [Actinomycetota bacterium]